MNDTYTTPPKDLVILAPCKDIEFAIRGLLSRIENSLVHSIKADIFVHPGHDASCLNEAHDFLRPMTRQYDHCMVLFDREGCGRDTSLRALTRSEIEENVESLLNQSGWKDRATVIVIDPEIEAWVWSDSPNVDNCLGWQGRQPGVRDWIKQNKSEFWHDNADKPQRPKEAMRAAMREVKKQPSSAIFEELGKSVSLNRCVDPAFNKFKTTLQTWFPQT